MGKVRVIKEEESDTRITYGRKEHVHAVENNNNKFVFSFPPGSPATSKCGPPQSRLRHAKWLSYTAHVTMILPKCYLFRLSRKYLFLLNSSSVS